MKAKNILLGLVGLFLLVLVYAPKGTKGNVKEVQLCDVTANDLKNKADYAIDRYFQDEELGADVSYKSYGHEEGTYQYNYKVVGQNVFGATLTQYWSVNIEYTRNDNGCIDTYRVREIFKN